MKKTIRRAAAVLAVTGVLTVGGVTQAPAAEAAWLCRWFPYLAYIC